MPDHRRPTCRPTRCMPSDPPAPRNLLHDPHARPPRMLRADDPTGVHTAARRDARLHSVTHGCTTRRTPPLARPAMCVRLAAWPPPDAQPHRRCSSPRSHSTARSSMARSSCCHSSIVRRSPRCSSVTRRSSHRSSTRCGLRDRSTSRSSVARSSSGRSSTARCSSRRSPATRRSWRSRSTSRSSARRRLGGGVGSAVASAWVAARAVAGMGRGVRPASAQAEMVSGEGRGWKGSRAGTGTEAEARGGAG